MMTGDEEGNVSAKELTISAVRRVEVTEPLAAVAAPYSYADAFKVELPPEPGVTPETWVRAGLTATPPLVRRLIGLLGRKRGAENAPDRLSVFRVVRSNSDVVVLEAALPIMRVAMIGREVGSSGRMLTTVLHFDRPSARFVWLLLAPLHRRTVRRILSGR